MSRIGFSHRKTVAYLYAWSLLLAGVAISLRFVPYHRGGRYHVGWVLVMIAIGVFALAASLYLIYILEILKLKGRRVRELRSLDPDTTEHEIDAQVRRDIETGEFERVR